MDGAKALAVLEKEVADARKNKMIVMSMALIPILLVALTLGTAYFMLELQGDEGLDEEDMSIIPPELRDMDPVHAFLMMMNDQYLFYFLIIPMMMPVYIAAYSVVGEKETKSLEPLLATPVTVWELLVGKATAAVVPSVILTWLSFLVLVVGGYLSMAVLAGKIFLSVAVVIMAAAVTLALDCAVFYFAVKLFQRETILTRWK
jgi:ABC-2 type transport system permease protein